MRFTDLVGDARRPEYAAPAVREPIETDTYLNQLTDEPRNNGFIAALADRRRSQRLKSSRRGFLRGTLTAAAAVTAASGASLFGPARKVQAQTGVVGTYPRRIMTFCPPYNSGDNCQPGCGSSPICTDCCGADGFFRNDPANGYTLYAGGCGDGDIADGWLWRFKSKCGNCAEIEYRCSDGYVQTDTGPAPFICRAVTACVPLPEGEAPGPDLADAARATNWRPAGRLEVAIDQGGSVSINGWISDGSGSPVQMRVRANNSIVHWGRAALPRPDIASTVQGAGANTGFAVSFPLDPGDYEFCVDALEGVLTATVGCVRLSVGSGGSVRGSGQTGTLAPAPTSTPSEAPAAASPDDSGAPVVATSPAPSPGQVVVPDVSGSSPSPTYGAVQVIRRSGDTTGFVSGWAGDPDTTDAVYIEVLVDGESASTSRTNLPRPDVNRAFADLHPTTGFALSFPVPIEATEVCVLAVSPDDGRRQELGCQRLLPATAVTEPVDPRPPTASGAPSTGDAVVYGGVDSVEVDALGATVRGWSFDPNDRDRVIDIVASASGRSAEGTTGEQNLAAQEIYGVDAACGFDLELALPPGIHVLSVAAVDSGGVPQPIGQQSVVIA